MAFRLSFCILIIVLCSTSIAQGCVERERTALLDFQKSFTPVLLWNVSNSENCCEWDGITCDHSGVHVTALDLEDQGLESHHLRPSLLELQHLTHLDLSGNNFLMRIPEFIGSFKELSYLDLSYADFFGSVPPQLANLSRLETLDLTDNELSTDNFHWLSHLSFLGNLFIGPIDLSGARDWLDVITKIPNLSEFECYSCSFPDALPTTHANSSSSQLQTLYLPDTTMSISNLSFLLNTTPHLSTINLDSLPLSIDIIDQIGNLCDLEGLYINSCSIKNSFSRVIQALGSGCASASLLYLALNSNSLTGLIPPLLMFPSFTKLYLDDNQLEGFATKSSAFQSPNPPQASYISSTNTTLLLNATHIFPQNLTTLSISNNTLSGVFLSEYFVNISHLDHLDIGHNPNLTVSFKEPPRQVEFLRLKSCNLGMGFPTWLPALKKLEHLDIAESNISGYIPIAFWESLSSQMFYLNLSNNNLQGTVPYLQPFSYQTTYPFISIIDLSSNEFSGSLPLFFFWAVHLLISKNNFTSFATLPYHAIPEFPIYYLVTNILDISYNNLSGEIPNWAWVAIFSFSTINLSNNNLSGRVPSLNAPPNLYVLNLSNNKFSGQIPSFLKNSTSLRILDLSRNRFSGSVPYWIGEDLSSLVVISLQSNNFMGNLPKNLCHLRSLQILDLSHNRLSGSIPPCVNNLSAMVHDVQSSDAVLITHLDERTGGGSSYVPMVEAQFYQALIKWKGMDQLFHKNLEYLRLIDLSYNNLRGEIPGELMSLIKLDSLDLSSNHFMGSIPSKVGQLKDLEYLNLSFNNFSGPIPTGLADITSLGVLDVSHNKLSGRIPKSTQLQSFDPSSFTENSGLCGAPLQVKCPGDPDDSTQPLQPPPTATHEGDEQGDMQWFYVGSGAGFACGFLGIIASLTWIKEWRYAFFRFATELGEWMLLVVALGASRISRKLRFK